MLGWDVPELCGEDVWSTGNRYFHVCKTSVKRGGPIISHVIAAIIGSITGCLYFVSKYM